MSVASRTQPSRWRACWVERFKGFKAIDDVPHGSARPSVGRSEPQAEVDLYLIQPSSRWGI